MNGRPERVGRIDSAREPGDASAQTQVSVVICTYNRAQSLASALGSVLAQPDDVPFELIVVDNNSGDDTAAVVEAASGYARHPVRYVFEGRQGLSHARNAGIRAAKAPVIAFTDDDILVAPDWVRRMAAVFSAHPDIDVAGGKVLPVWPSPPPSWLTRDHWAPLAIVDWGDEPIVASLGRPLVLVGANLSVRRSLFDRIGTFDPALQRIKDGIGSTEDHGFLMRAYRAGCKGLYEPGIVVHAAVQPERLTKRYHRRWHAGHGRFFARMLLAESPPGTPLIYGVPGYCYRAMLREALGHAPPWLRAALRRDDAVAFYHENEIREALHYVRALPGVSGSGRGVLAELASFAVRYTGRRMRGGAGRAKS